MGLKDDSGEGCVQSYQVPSKVQGEAGNACEGRMKCVHRGAWRCMGQTQQDIHGSCMHAMHPVAYPCPL